MTRERVCKDTRPHQFGDFDGNFEVSGYRTEFEARMQILIFRFMALSPLTLPAGFPLNLSIGVLADCRAVIKFAFKLTGFLSALLRGLVSFRCRWRLGWRV
jgi:hypothetical protein